MSKPLPSLSVIVPFYNVAAYAAQTVRSLRGNAADDVEFVLVDDASTDETPAILAEDAGRLPGARVITCARNGGLSAARNVGLGAARGTYLTFLDGDDVVAPGYYPELLATVRRLGCDFVRTDHVQFRGLERSVTRIHHGPRRVVGRPREAILPADRVTSVDAAHAWAGVYTRRLLEAGLLHFDPRLRTCEDRPWIWRLHLQAESFAVVGLLGVHYRRGVASSLTQVTDERQLDFLPAFDAVVAAVLADPDADRLLPKALRSYVAITWHHLARTDRYSPDLAAQLRLRCRLALARLPEAPLRGVLAQLDPVRRVGLTRLLEAA
ncbi:MAG: glycosyltransferase family 2 protein [Actinomycetes bacterium]